MNQIHGHDVLNMMLASGKTYTKATLVADIVKKFGRDAKFHTCSAEDMTYAAGGARYQSGTEVEG